VEEMIREKKKILNYRINTTYNKLKKSSNENNNSKKYKLFNIIYETGNSIYSPVFEELTVMEQLELLRYAFDSMDSLVSNEEVN